MNSKVIYTLPSGFACLHDNFQVEVFMTANCWERVSREAMMECYSNHETIKQLTHERQLLAEAIGNLAVRLKIADSTVPMNGPMLLMLAEDIGNLFESKEGLEEDHF